MALCILEVAHLFSVHVQSYTIFDLAPVVQLQEQYLNAHSNDTTNTAMRYMTLEYFDTDKLNTNSFLISNYAFSEISQSLQKEYIQHLFEPFVSHGFLTWNFIPFYNFISNKTFEVEPEFPSTGHSLNNNLYVRFSPTTNEENT